MVREFRNLTYDERLEKANLTSLETRRIRGDLIEVFKIMQGFDNVENEQYFVLEGHGRTRGHNFKISKKRFYTDKGKYMFANRVVEEWNRLEEEIVSSESVNSKIELLSKKRELK